MSYTVAGIDVHKKLLVVVVADVSQPELSFECRRFGTVASELYNLGLWLCERGVAEAVMESTAQYWKPVWLELEPHLRLHLAQAQSNRAPKGRKSDFGDAKRLLRRFLAGELALSFVPDAEQRAWRTLTRARLQLVCERVQLQGQIESLLEDGRIKLSAVISDLLGVSGRRILRALADGQTDPQQLAQLGDERLRCGRAVLADALTGSTSAIHRKLLGQHLDRVQLIDRQIEELSRLSAEQMQPYQEAIVRLIELPGVVWRRPTRLSRKSVPGPRHSHPGANWLPGSVCVRGPTRARPKTTPAAAPKGIASCGGCCAKPHRPG